jgi:hypothetical protein
MIRRRLHLIEVPAPCPVRWDSMHGAGTARTCASCARPVHDLAAMTTAEAEALLAPSGERICVRIERAPES